MTTWNIIERAVRSVVLLLAIPALLFGCGGGGGGSSNTAASHIVTATAGTGGAINPASTTVDDGATTSFTVTPDSGYLISSVSGCSGSLSGNTYTTGAITADCTVTAGFIVPAAVTHTVTASAGTGGAISPTTATINDGATTSFTVTPNSGYIIDSVTGCSGSLSVNTYTTGAITADCTVTASFIVPAAVTHTVTAIAGTGGTISPASTTVNDSATASFTVTPDSGYSIDSVSGCGGSLSGNTYTTAAITADCSVSASFIATHSVTATAGTGGAISPANTTVNDGATASFTVTPDSGYSIDSVSGCGGSLSGNTYTTAAITADCSVSASFIATHSVTATAGTGGAISPANTTVNDGATASFTVTPDSGYSIDSVSGCGGSLSGNTYTTAAITADCTVTASFVINTYTVGGTVSGLSGSGLVLQNNGGDDLPVAGVSFTFATALNHGSSYTVTVLTQPTGQSCTVGNGSGTLNGANVTDVAVTCKGWGTAGLIENDNAGHARNPQIAVDGNDNALAVWSQSDGTRYNIWANHYTAGSGWGAAELLENDNTGDAVYPQIAINGNGDAVAVWNQSDGTRWNIWAKRYTAGAGWSSAELIESDNTGTAIAGDINIGIDANSNALAVWTQNDGTYYNIWANRYIAGGGWGSAELVELDDTAYSQTPRIAIDNSGNAWVAWNQSGNIWANRYTAGSGWGSAELIESGQNPQIAFDNSDNAMLVWEQFDGTYMNIWANRYTAGSGWGTAELIENYTAGNGASPQIAFDVNGNALAVWMQASGVRFDIAANRYTASSGWGTAELIESDNAGDARDPQVAIDSNRNVLAVWNQSDGTRWNIWANRYIAEIGWGTAELIESDNAGSAGFPQIAIDGSDNALVVWSQNDGTRDNIWANRFE